MCDQISDAVLDAHLKQDPEAKVACGMSARIKYHFIEHKFTKFLHFRNGCQNRNDSVVRRDY